MKHEFARSVWFPGYRPGWGGSEVKADLGWPGAPQDELEELSGKEKEECRRAFRLLWRPTQTREVVEEDRLMNDF